MLKKIDLNNNGITFLPEEFFLKNRELKAVSLSGNKLSSLPCNLLKHQYGLTALNITDNMFTSIPCHVINRQGAQLSEFDATNNMIHVRYNQDLSHKRGVAFKLNKKGLKANGKVQTDYDDETGDPIFIEGNENQVAGTLHMICDVCNKLPPKKVYYKRLREMDAAGSREEWLAEKAEEEAEAQTETAQWPGLLQSKLLT